MSIDKEIQLMIHYQLNVEELMFVKLIFVAQEDHPELLMTYTQQVPNITSLRDILQSLKDKGIILKSFKVPDKGEYLNIKDIPFNKLFLHSYFKHSDDLGGELFDLYPKQMAVNNTYVFLRNISKYYTSFEDFCYAYGKAIRFDPNKHEFVINMLKKGIEYNLIKYGICEFVISRKWEEIQVMVESDNVFGYNNTELI